MAQQVAEPGDIGRLDLAYATRFPVTSSDDWCGDYEISTAATRVRLESEKAAEEQAALDRRHAAALAPADDDDRPW